MAGIVTVIDDRGAQRTFGEGVPRNKSEATFKWAEIERMRAVSESSSVRAATDIILRGVGNVATGKEDAFTDALSDLVAPIYRQQNMWGIAFVIDTEFEGEHVPRIYVPSKDTDEIICIRNDMTAQLIVAVRTHGILRPDILVLVKEQPIFGAEPRFSSPCKVLWPHYDYMVRSFNDLRALSTYLASTPLVLVGKPTESVKTHENAISRSAISMYENTTTGLFNAMPGAATYGDELITGKEEKGPEPVGLPVTSVAIGGIMRPVVKIPDGQTPAAIPAPSHGLKADEIASTYGTQVAAIYGVPSHLIRDAKLQRIQANTTEELDQVISAVSVQLGRELQKVCDVMYADKKVTVKIEFSHRLSFQQLLSLGAIADKRDILKVISQRFGDTFRPSKDDVAPVSVSSKKPRQESSEGSPPPPRKKRKSETADTRKPKRARYNSSDSS